jgi:uncharacterized protein YndB with AHSA1/START domain
VKNSGTFKITTPSDREIVITRVFDTPRRLVWDASTKPELIRRWLVGPPGWVMTTCELDLRVGGRYRWAWRDLEDLEIAMHGVHREIVAPEKLVRTEQFDVGCPPQAGEQLATLALSEKDGRTTLTITVLYPSKEARDGVLASGMEHGMAAGYDRLEELLAAPNSASRGARS